MGKIKHKSNMSKTISCIERKMQFQEFQTDFSRIVFSKTGFSVSAEFDLSYDKGLVLDSFIDESNFKIATCTFGFLLSFNEKSEKIGFMVSDRNCFCVCSISEKNSERKFSFLLPWQRLSKTRGKAIYFLKIDVSDSNIFFYINDKKNPVYILKKRVNDVAKLEFASQNYMVHEKVICEIKRLRIKKLRTELKAKVCETNGIEKIAETNCASFVRENFDEEWAYYQQARELYEKGDFLKAKSFILAAASALSENLAILELYGFICSKIDSDELPRIIRLIESNKKHAPYVQSYRDECEKLIQRLQESLLKNKNVNLKFSLDNRADFLLEKPLIQLI